MNKPKGSIQRRLRALEAIIVVARIPEYPPLTAAEVDAFALRIQRKETLTRIEVDRLERQSPILQGELLMTCHRGRVHVKRYIGVNLAEV